MSPPQQLLIAEASTLRGELQTQAVATHLHATTDVSGLTFASRHGDDLTLWAIFERSGDPAISPTLSRINHQPLTPDAADVVEAFRILGLSWAE